MLWPRRTTLRSRRSTIFGPGRRPNANRHWGSAAGLLLAIGGLGMWCGPRVRGQTQRQRASH